MQYCGFRRNSDAMCVNFTPTTPQQLEDDFQLKLDLDWPAEAWPDYAAPIIVRGNPGRRAALLAGYGFKPKYEMAKGVHYDTQNARAETVGSLKSYRSAWAASQLCLIPMSRFFEPYYETAESKSVRWQIGMADDSSFAVAGLWRPLEPRDGKPDFAFTQLTVNADDHPVMRRFHKPGDEKRSLIIVPCEEYDDFLQCIDPERARSFMALFPAELMKARPAPRPPRVEKPKPVVSAQLPDGSSQGGLDF